jgi:cytochrome oxidase Cu insertion factor (SCO1/SenC/PrrC family)
MKNYLILVALFFQINAFGQLADGSVAPDFTLTDYYGNSHHLYSYLDSGKTVYMEVFAAHCPSCWNYHQTNRLKNLYNQYGPDGTDELMVLALEHDQYNDSVAFMGNHQPWVTQGDWLTGTPYPLFNVEWPDRGVFADYNVTYYPVIYKICPNRVLEQVFVSTSEATLYQKVQECQTISLGELEEVSWSVFYNSTAKRVVIESEENIRSFQIYNLLGQPVGKQSLSIDSEIDVSDLDSGIYLFEFQIGSEKHMEKLYVY